MDNDYDQWAGKDLMRIARVLYAGDCLIGGALPMTTLLGSCVSVCLWDSALYIGGMNHFLLPKKTVQKESGVPVRELLAGEDALETLLEKLSAQGSKKRNLKAKVVGGGIMHADRRCPVGVSNAAFALEWLDEKGIAVIGSDLGGPWSRKVLFLPKTGVAFCRRASALPSRGFSCELHSPQGLGDI